MILKISNNKNGIELAKNLILHHTANLYDVMKSERTWKSDYSSNVFGWALFLTPFVIKIHFELQTKSLDADDNMSPFSPWKFSEMINICLLQDTYGHFPVDFPSLFPSFITSSIFSLFIPPFLYMSPFSFFVSSLKGNKERKLIFRLTF